MTTYHLLIQSPSNARYASQPVKAFAKQELEPYCGMAKAFSENDDAALQAVVVAHEQELKQVR